MGFCRLLRGDETSTLRRFMVHYSYFTVYVKYSGFFYNSMISNDKYDIGKIFQNEVFNLVNGRPNQEVMSVSCWGGGGGSRFNELSATESLDHFQNQVACIFLSSRHLF